MQVNRCTSKETTQEIFISWRQQTEREGKLHCYCILFFVREKEKKRLPDSLVHERQSILYVSHQQNNKRKDKWIDNCSRGRRFVLLTLRDSKREWKGNNILVIIIVTLVKICQKVQSLRGKDFYSQTRERSCKTKASRQKERQFKRRLKHSLQRIEGRRVCGRIIASSWEVISLLASLIIPFILVFRV